MTYFITKDGKIKVDVSFTPVSKEFSRNIEERNFILKEKFKYGMKQRQELTGWKLAYIRDNKNYNPSFYESNFCIVELKIPFFADKVWPKKDDNADYFKWWNVKNSDGFCANKCRASRAVVSSIFTIRREFGKRIFHLTKDATAAAESIFDPSFIYKTEETIRPIYKFNKSIKDSCKSGIHFFLTIEEALLYRL